MRKNILLLSLVLLVAFGSQAQGLKGLIKKVVKDSATNAAIDKKIDAVNSGDKAGLSTTDVAAGLKQALEAGAERSSTKLSSVDGFFKDAALKILMPAEAQNAEKKLRALGFGKQVDNAILSMNRAAEDASKSAATIFINSIKQMTITDAVGILRGGNDAATTYLKSHTTTELTNAFRPVIEASLAKVDATKYWSNVFSTYNKFSAEKVNPDITAYVTEKALAGIFTQVAREEQQIRKDPMARTTDLMKKVFGSNQ